MEVMAEREHAGKISGGKIPSVRLGWEIPSGHPTQEQLDSGYLGASPGWEIWTLFLPLVRPVAIYPSFHFAEMVQVLADFIFVTVPHTRCQHPPSSILPTGHSSQDVGMSHCGRHTWPQALGCYRLWTVSYLLP